MVKTKRIVERKTDRLGEFGGWVADCATTISQYNKPATGNLAQDKAREQTHQVDVYAFTRRLFSDGIGNTHYRFRASSNVYHAFAPKASGRIVLEYDFIHSKEDGEFEEGKYALQQLASIGQSAQANARRYPTPLELSVEIVDNDVSPKLIVKELKDKEYPQ